MVDNVLVQGYIGGDVSDDDAIHETTPLLERVPSSSSGLSESDETAAPWCQLSKPQHIAFVTCLGVFLWVLSGTLAIVPVMSLVQDNLCRRYYQENEPDQFRDDGSVIGIDEQHCKIPEVQSRMAFLIAFSFMLNGILGLLVALPFGVLADRARKPVYVLGAVGQSLSVAWTLSVLYCWETLPVELVLAGAVFQLLGGGLLVAIAVLYAMLSDVLPAESR